MKWPHIPIGFICSLVMLVMTGCSKQPNNADYRDVNRCYSSLKSYYGKIAIDVIETHGKNTVQPYARNGSNGEVRTQCPIVGKPYVVNPKLSMWTDLKSSDAAVVCPKPHPSATRLERKYLAITFEGQLTELPELPDWATPSSKLKENDNSVIK